MLAKGTVPATIKLRRRRLILQAPAGLQHRCRPHRAPHRKSCHVRLECIVVEHAGFQRFNVPGFVKHIFRSGLPQLTANIVEGWEMMALRSSRIDGQVRCDRIIGPHRPRELALVEVGIGRLPRDGRGTGAIDEELQILVLFPNCRINAQLIRRIPRVGEIERVDVRGAVPRRSQRHSKRRCSN